jgi:hypothetical protein
VQREQYLGLIRDAGFIDVAVPKEKPIVIPEDVIQSELAEFPAELRTMGGARLISVTVRAVKP